MVKAIVNVVVVAVASFTARMVWCHCHKRPYLSFLGGKQEESQQSGTRPFLTMTVRFSLLAVQGKLNVSGACPTGRIRDMCHVAAANGESGDEDSAGSEGSLVTVTSTGGVHVWGVPALDVDGTGGAEEELRLPLLATHSLKVGGAVGGRLAVYKIRATCLSPPSYFRMLSLRC